MTNKAGFTDEQQKDLTNLIELGQYTAAIVTLLCVKKVSQLEIEQVLREVRDFAQRTYPGGPRELASKLNKISAFCDLAIITTPVDMDTGKIM